MHQASSHLPVLPTGMRVPSGASAISTASSVMSARSAAPVFATGDPCSTWEMWDCIRRMCNYHPRLSVSECRFALSWRLRWADGSFGLDPSATAVGWSIIKMDSGTRQEHLAPGFGLHLQRQRLSRSIQSMPSVPSRYGKGKSLFAFFSSPQNIDS